MNIIGSFDWPFVDRPLRPRRYNVLGHLFSPQGEDCSIDIFLDDILIEQGRWGFPRYDIYQTYLSESSYKSGFVAPCNFRKVPDGVHELKVIGRSATQEIILDVRKVEIDRTCPALEPHELLRYPAGPTSSAAQSFAFRADIRRLFQTECQLLPSHSVLDIGCGFGRIAMSLTDFLDINAYYYGLDVLPEVITYNTRHISSRHPNFRFQHINVQNDMYNKEGGNVPNTYTLPLGNNSIDLVYLWSVFTHMYPDDIAHYVKEIERVLRPGGHIFATHFIMTKEKEESSAQIGNRIFSFKQKNYWTTNKNHPLAAIAFSQEQIKDFYSVADLTLEKIFFSGTTTLNTTHDIIIAQKAK